MLLKRFRADIVYAPDSQGECPELKDLIEEARKRVGAGIVINEGLDNEERGFFEIEDCLHDGDPFFTHVDSCIVIERWQTGRGQVI